MKLAMAVNYVGDPHAAAAQARELETRGIDLAWMAELYSFDAVSILGYLAATTERLELMAGILPIYSCTIQDLYLDHRQAEASELIPDEFLVSSNLIGDEAFIRDRVDAFQAAGVTYLQATPVGADPLGDAARLREILG